MNILKNIGFHNCLNLLVPILSRYLVDKHIFSRNNNVSKMDLFVSDENSSTKCWGIICSSFQFTVKKIFYVGNPFLCWHGVHFGYVLWPSHKENYFNEKQVIRQKSHLLGQHDFLYYEFASGQILCNSYIDIKLLYCIKCNLLVCICE